MTGIDGLGTAVRYLMRKDLISTSEDFWIEDQEGKRAFKVDGKVFEIRHTVTIQVP